MAGMGSVRLQRCQWPCLKLDSHKIRVHFLFNGVIWVNRVYFPLTLAPVFPNLTSIVIVVLVTVTAGAAVGHRTIG